jgi:hypothetical protein
VRGYKPLESDHTTLAQDANALAVLFGIAPADKVPGIVSALKALWGPAWFSALLRHRL